ncbi:MAG: acetyltransferase [Blastocatellia bacterium]|nr:acetyltransferase [Blastocatellia bacterium]
MNNIVVIGSSGHAKVVIDILEKQGLYRIAGLIDGFRVVGGETSGYQILGSETDLPRLCESHRIVGGVVAIGDNFTRHKVVSRIAELLPDFPFVTAVHPGAIIAAHVTLGNGTVVMAGATVNPGTTVGSHCILNTQSSLDHDCRMGDFASLAPRAVTGGNVHIGQFSAISIGAIIKHGIEIGEHSVIGAGATVLFPIPAFSVAFGTPARIVRSRIAGERYL